MRLTQRPLDRLGRAAAAPIRPVAGGVLRYLAHLSAGRFVLWCYFVWCLVVLVRYFDPSLDVWLTSLGLSVIIGIALLINTTRSGRSRVKLEPWPTFRLFLTPFCVSSFAALVKGRGFVLIFSPKPVEMLAALAICAALGGAVFAARRVGKARAPVATS